MEKVKKNFEKKKIMISKSEWKKLVESEKILKEALKILRVEDKDLPRVVERFQKEVREMEDKIASKGKL